MSAPQPFPAVWVSSQPTKARSRRFAQAQGKRVPVLLRVREPDFDEPGILVAGIQVGAPVAALEPDKFPRL